MLRFGFALRRTKTSQTRRFDGNFIDYMRIKVSGGPGGNGVPSFDHDSRSTKGRASGGNGGAGGDVVIVGDSSLESLNHLRKKFTGERGGYGGRNMMEGRAGKDSIIRVPLGTEIREISNPSEPDELDGLDEVSEFDKVDGAEEVEGDEETDFVLVDDFEETEFSDEIEADEKVEEKMQGLKRDSTQNPKMRSGRYQIEAPVQSVLKDISISNETDPPIIVAKGGRGGSGNYTFGNNNHDHEKGQPGEERFLEINLKTIADVGLVGLPNAGKSSFLRTVSNAHPKVAEYPFTTMNPYVGVVEFPDQGRLTVADIPGLIEGAYLDKGLGHQFLKHIVKAKILALVVDFSKEEPWRDVQTLLQELDLFQEGLAAKCKLVIANKADLLDGPTLISRINSTKSRISALYSTSSMDILPISALHGFAITKVTSRMRQLLIKP